VSVSEIRTKIERIAATYKRKFLCSSKSRDFNKLLTTSLEILNNFFLKELKLLAKDDKLKLINTRSAAKNIRSL